MDQQKLVQSLDSRTYVYNNDYIGAASYNIFAGIFTAFIFGAAFFFDLFWPTRREDHGIRVAWKACGVMAVIFQGASAFCLTIITAMREGYVTGVSPDRARELLSNFKKDGGSPLVYRHNGRAVAATVFVWPGWICVILSCVLLFLSIDNAEKGPGPLTKHAREEGTQEPQSEHQANFMDLDDKVDDKKPKRSRSVAPAADPRAPLPPNEISQAAATGEHAGTEQQTSQHFTPAAENPPTMQEAHA